MIIIGKINNEEIIFHSMEELEGFDRFNDITHLCCNYCELMEIPILPKKLLIFYCDHNRIRKIKNLPNSLRYFSCECNLIAEIKNLHYHWNGVEMVVEEDERLPESLLEFYCDNDPITNKMEIKKWEYICKRNQERDKYRREHFPVPSIGIELGGFQSYLMISPIGDTLGSLFYL